MPVAVVRTGWSGTSGGPGVTQMHVLGSNGFDELTAGQAQTAVNAVRQFWSAVSGYLPNEIVLITSPVVDQYDIASGELVSSVSAGTAPASVVGTSTAIFSMPTGVKMNLNTATIRNGRRVRGGVYIVPAASNVYSDAGAVSNATRTALNTAGAAMINSLTTAGLQLAVYSRPVPSGQPNGPRSGGVANVTTMEANEKAAILRGRRD